MTNTLDLVAGGIFNVPDLAREPGVEGNFSLGGSIAQSWGNGKFPARNLYANVKMAHFHFPAFPAGAHIPDCAVSYRSLYNLNYIFPDLWKFCILYS